MIICGPGPGSTTSPSTDTCDEFCDKVQDRHTVTCQQLQYLVLLAWLGITP